MIGLLSKIAVVVRYGKILEPLFGWLLGEAFEQQERGA